MLSQTWAQLEKISMKSEGVSTQKRPRGETKGPRTMDPEILQLALTTRGFLLAAEGLELFQRALAASPHGPCLELGSYCGRSTVFLAQGCRQADGHPLFCVDHHRGSDEQQPGEEYFDPELFDAETGVVDTLGPFRRTLHQANLADWAIPLVVEATLLSRYWSSGSFQLVFIDGSHDQAAVDADYENWGTRVASGGYLCIHDIFPDPADGGQAPYNTFQRAVVSGLWEVLPQVESLGVLRRR